MPQTSPIEFLLEKTLEDLPTKEYLWSPKNDSHTKKPNRIIELTVALNIAFKNYESMRPKQSGANRREPLQMGDLTQKLLRYLSNKFYKNIDRVAVEESEIISKTNTEYKALEQFRTVEYCLFGTLEHLRNYFSHYVHEPGIKTFEDFIKNAKKLDCEELIRAKNWYFQRFTEAKEHLMNSLRVKKGNPNYATEAKSIQTAINALDKISFFKNQNVLTNEGVLFIACLFLYRHQAKIIIQKWFSEKSLKGYGSTIMTLFSYYSLKESYSVNNYHDDLLQFRTIVSLLSTLPVIDSSNKQIRALYEEVYNHNDSIIAELEKPPGKSEKKPEELQKELIPLRKRYVFTDLFLQYLLDNECIPKCFKIAIHKTPKDTEEYFENNKVLHPKENLAALKDRITSETDSQKKDILKTHYKELKRNFIFKNPSELLALLGPLDKDINGEPETTPATENPANKDKENTAMNTKEVHGFRFAVKKKNALLRYNDINVILSPQIIQKWVFLILNGVDNNDIVNIIKKAICTYSNAFQKESLEEVKEYLRNNQTLELKKILPKSILSCVENPQFDFLKEKTEEALAIRIQKLEAFKEICDTQPNPYRFASNKKIKIILDYLQFCLLKEVHIDKKFEGDPEVYFRHNFFNVTAYKRAFQYFRYFGRYKNNSIYCLSAKGENVVLPEYISALKSEYKKLFSFIQEIDKDSKNLEEVFNKVIVKFIQGLKNLNKQKDKECILALAKVLKIRNRSNTDNITRIYRTFYNKNFSLHPEVLSIKTLCKKEWDSFKQAHPKKENASDFALIRNTLSLGDNIPTNADFILKKCLFSKGQKITSTILKKIMQIKTEELLLWNVAKTYWEKAQGQPYELQFKPNKLPAYKDFNLFYSIYEQEIDHKITVKKKYLDANKEKFSGIDNPDKGGIEFTIKIPVRRYDNRFLGFEKDLIADYVLWNHYKNNAVNIPEKHKVKNSKGNEITYNLTKYDDLIKCIRKELRSSFDYCFLVLNSEKKKFTDEIIKDLIREKYGNNTIIKNFYLEYSYYLKKKFGETLPQPKYIKHFRNYAMHYQLQDPEQKTSVIDELFKDSEVKELPTCKASVQKNS